jgi:hypothetical protein
VVQVLPAVPSFGEKLATVLGQAGADISQGFAERHQNQRDQEIINSFDMNASPIDQIKKFSQLSSQKQAALTPLLQQYLKTQSTQQTAQMAEQKENEQVGENINSLMDKLEEGNVGKFNQWNKLFAKGREDRAYFDEIALGIEKRLATMVGKGALSKPRFEYLLSQLPKSSDTDATNRGKLKALAEEFKVIRKSKPSVENESKQRRDLSKILG